MTCEAASYVSGKSVAASERIRTGLRLWRHVWRHGYGTLRTLGGDPMKSRSTSIGCDAPGAWLGSIWNRT